MVSVVSTKLGVLLEKIDSNGLLPMRAVDRVFPTAYAFRRFLQKELPAYLNEKPKPDPLRRVMLKPLRSLSGEVSKRWPRATGKILKGGATVLSTLSIDHRVGVAPFAGGSLEAKMVLKAFLNKRLSRYGEDRNQPEQEVTSGLSPYLHFGHISAHEVFHKIAGKEEWSLAHLSSRTNGARSGWWGMGEPAEAFLDQLVTWRELGFNMSWQEKDHERYESLPHWARTTLERHARDRRPYLYTAGQFERAQTHDPLWNAAQTQLLKEGRVHNYLRMLWGKKILHWSSSPRNALKIMIDLNNKYALDGRDPNSYSGIFWILGRYDRAWGPERSVFGKVRYMSSANTQRKLHAKEYLKRWI
jgi:deoxyribodipyrimidine photo-lyase